MRNILLLCGLVLLFSHRADARPYNGGDKDSIRLKDKEQLGSNSPSAGVLRSFPELDKYLQQNGLHGQNLNVPYSAIAEFTHDYINANYSKVLSQD